MLTTAILGALVSFGGYSSNLSNSPRLYGNNISIHTYYDLNKYSANEVYHFHDIIIYNVDIEHDSEEGFTVYINDVSVRTYLIDNANNNSETSIRSSSQFFDDEDLATRGIPLRFDDDTRWISVAYNDVTVSGNTLSYEVRTFWDDDNLDTGVGVIEECSFSAANTVYGVARYNRFEVAMDDLYKQVRDEFALQESGYLDGYGMGYDQGYNDGSANGYNTGYSDGYTAGVSIDQTGFTIFNGILNIGMLPINVFLAMFNFEVFGINLSNFVMSLLTLSVSIWVIRTISGGGDDK